MVLILCTTSRNVIKIDDRNNSHIESSAQGKDKRVYKKKHEIELNHIRKIKSKLFQNNHLQERKHSSVFIIFLR